MIYKKTIKHGQMYFSDVLFNTHMHCDSCGEGSRGEGLIRLRLVTPEPIELITQPDTLDVRVLFNTSEEAHYYINLYRHTIQYSLGLSTVNTLTGDEGVRVMEDIAVSKESSHGFTWRNNSVYIGLDKVTLDFYYNEAAGDVMCPNCESIEDVIPAGIEVGVAGPLSISSKLREGYSDEHDIGLNLDDVSVMISLVDITGEPISAPRGDIVVSDTAKNALKWFMEAVPTETASPW